MEWPSTIDYQIVMTPLAHPTALELLILGGGAVVGRLILSSYGWRVIAGTLIAVIFIQEDLEDLKNEPVKW